MHEIMIKNNLGFKWVQNSGVYTTGYIFDGKNSFKRDENLNRYFSNCNDEEVFRNILINTNGFFAVIMETENYIFAAVDRIRSIPLFYGYINGDFYISDDARYIKEKVKDEEMNELSKIEFLLTGYVTNNDTLYSNVKQIRAGEYLVFDKINNRLKLQRYFEFRHKDFYDLSEEELIEELDKVHVNTIRRLIDSLEGRTAVIPLSGGQDSRLMAIMLKRLGYENVICFTYGKPGNWESEISKKIADYLGYKWIFIPYTRKNQYSMYNSSKRKEYSFFADGLTSLPHIQDFYAVYEMKEKRLVPEDSVFIPGHAADFIEGSHIPPWFLDKGEISKEELIQSIYDKHYSLWDWSKQKDKLDFKFTNKILKVVGSIDNCNPEEAADIFECWDWQERQAKFIANSIRVYEFLGYEWRLPLWDNEMMSYWSKIPVNLRVGRNLYYKYVDKKQDSNLPQSNPKRSKIRRGFDRINDPGYGRFENSKSFLPICLKKVKHVITNFDSDIVEKNELMILANTNGLHTAKYFDDLIKKKDEENDKYN